MHTIRELPIVVGKQKVPDAWVFSFPGFLSEILQVWTTTTYRYVAGKEVKESPYYRGHLRIRTPVGKPEGHAHVVVVAEHPSGSTSLPVSAGDYHGTFLNGDRRWFVFSRVSTTDGASCSLPVFRDEPSESPGPPEL